MRAIVTGGASGLGAAMVARLRAEEYEVLVLDLTTGFDVADPDAWEEIDGVDVACLNAGVLGGPADPAELKIDDYRRAIAVNVDGVVLGVRRLARVMPAGGRIVATASLAGLTAMSNDPVYAATKHAVVGFVRSVAPALEERGILINAICPGIADTPMVAGEARRRLERADFPLLAASAVADAVWLALASGLTGHAWVVQPGRPPLDFRFPNVPGRPHARRIAECTSPDLARGTSSENHFDLLEDCALEEQVVAMFLVVLRRSGPRWDPSRPMEEQADWPAHASL